MKRTRRPPGARKRRQEPASPDLQESLDLQLPVSDNQEEEEYDPDRPSTWHVLGGLSPAELAEQDADAKRVTRDEEPEEESARPRKKLMPWEDNWLPEDITAEEFAILVMLEEMEAGIPPSESCLLGRALSEGDDDTSDSNVADAAGGTPSPERADR